MPPLSSRPARRSRSGPAASSSPFFWVALALGAAFLLLFVAEGVRDFTVGLTRRSVGWTAIRSGSDWRVDNVDPVGPAAGRLQPGDRIRAIDGDSRVAVLGPRWAIQHLPPGRAYLVDVERDRAPVRAPLKVEAVPDPRFLKWIVIYLAVGAAFAGVGLTVGLAKPDSRAIQCAFGSSMLIGCFMLWMAARPFDGVRSDVVVLALGLAYPLYFPLGYLFYEHFPVPVDATSRWRRVRRLVVALGVMLWVPRASMIGLRLLGPAVAVDVLAPVARLIHLYEAIVAPAELLYVAGAVAAMFAVLGRNYRLLPGGSDRRRIAIVIGSQIAALVPALMVAAAKGITGSTPEAGEAPLLDLAAGVANAAAIVQPIAMGYAVVKHRVLGFRVFVRLGVQYLLASQVLRAAAVLPLAWLFYTIVVNRDRTVGELLFTGAARLNLLLIALAGLALRFRAPLASAIDRRFFRAAYDQEQILARLIEAIKTLDSIPDVSRLVHREIDAALHVTRVVVLYREPVKRDFSVGYSSDRTAGGLRLPDQSPLLAQMAAARDPQTLDDVWERCGDDEAEWLERLGIELIVPISGLDWELVGLLLVGAKRSEEPYTSRDRATLHMVAAQIGSVYQILALRQKVGQQQKIQTEVLGRLARDQFNVMRECPACGACYDSTAGRCDADGAELVLTLPVERVVDGKYSLERLIGRGGMGAVYLAADLRLGRRVAVKVMTGGFLHSTAALRRFAREAQASALLEHPHIVRVYDYAQLSEDTAYIVMEYVRGITWRAELTRRGAFESALAAHLLDQVLDGMAAAHAARVLHRDLKPENLLIASPPSTGGPIVKILDFGLAKVREQGWADPKSLTSAGMAMGTFGYMAPEQFAGEDVDERADVYSLGVIALEALTGRLPMDGLGFHRQIESELRRRLVEPAATAEARALADAIRRALAPSRVDRFSSVVALREALVPAIRSCPALPIGRTAVVPAASSPAGDAPLDEASRPTGEWSGE